MKHCVSWYKEGPYNRSKSFHRNNSECLINPGVEWGSVQLKLVVGKNPPSLKGVVVCVLWTFIVRRIDGDHLHRGWRTGDYCVE